MYPDLCKIKICCHDHAGYGVATMYIANCRFYKGKLRIPKAADEVGSSPNFKEYLNRCHTISNYLGEVVNTLSLISNYNCLFCDYMLENSVYPSLT